MKWYKAVEYMEKGGKITRKSWLANDFLFLRNGVLFCDGEFPYLKLLKNTSGEWIKYKERG